MVKNMGDQGKRELEEKSGLQIPKKVKCLGIQLTMENINLFEDNYNKIWKEIKKDMEIWTKLKLTLWGRISAIKMNILPKLLFLFQMISIIGKMECFNQWKKDLAKFLWEGKKPGIKYKLLMDSKERGGFGLPDLRIYYEAACLCCLKDWIMLDNTDILDLEGWNIRFGWHAYLMYNKMAVHKGFLNHLTRNPLYKIWIKYR